MTFPAPPEARKQQDAQTFLQQHAQGTYDNVYVYVLGVIGDSSVSSDADFPASGGAWRAALREQLRAADEAVQLARGIEVGARCLSIGTTACMAPGGQGAPPASSRSTRR